LNNNDISHNLRDFDQFSESFSNANGD